MVCSAATLKLCCESGQLFHNPAAKTLAAYNTAHNTLQKQLYTSALLDAFPLKLTTTPNTTVAALQQAQEQGDEGRTGGTTTGT